MLYTPRIPFSYHYLCPLHLTLEKLGVHYVNIFFCLHIDRPIFFIRL